MQCNAFKERIAGLWKKVTGKKTLKDIVEDEAEKEHKQDQEEAEKEQQDDINLTPKEHATSLKWSLYRSFRSPGLAKDRRRHLHRENHTVHKVVN